jgi:pSer/pThr/pTyr-binding forkhead associated (FHA) protein
MTQHETIGPWAVVVLGEGVMGLHRLPAEGEVVVGRSGEAGLVLRHPSLSRRHLRLRVGGRVTVEDLGSRHGTVVAGRSLPPGVEQVIGGGELMQLGAISIGLVRAG